VTPTSEDPNIALVQRFFAAYAEHDLEKMREEILAPDVTWRIPGHHPLAGVKRGADEILAYFGALPRANFQAEPIVIAAQGDYVIDVHRGWASYGDATLDMEWVLVYRVAAGRIQEVTNFAADQHAADLFFWEVWGDDLKPLPDRLRNGQAPSRAESSP
jgi:ketosteroid isomerase-like protein